jgi:hypothetical protein
MANLPVTVADSLVFAEQAIYHCPAVFDLDLTDDYCVFDNKEEITYTREGTHSRAASGIVTSIDDQVFTIKSALRHMVAERDIRIMEGYIQVDDVKWDIPIDQLGVNPKVGDIIEDADGVQFRVIAINKKTLKSRWHLFARET